MQMSLRNFSNSETRREQLEADLELDLSALIVGDLPEFVDLEGRNIENPIGQISLPVGVAGPVKLIHVREETSTQHVVPLATSEGALVASISRGCKAISESGGVEVTSQLLGVTRAPLLEFADLELAVEAREWIERNFVELAGVAAATSGHLELLRCETFQLGRQLWLRLSYKTGEAMGMNMASKASQAVVDLVIENFVGSRLVTLSGNMCIDKKPAALTAMLGRGWKVDLSIEIPGSICERVLRATPVQISEVNLRKTWQGSAIAGAIGANAQTANVVAAVFAATGQDLAQVVDSSTAFVSLTVGGETGGDLVAELSAPGILVGTVGGGTGLPAQKQARELMLKPIESSSAQLSQLGQAAQSGQSGQVSKSKQPTETKVETMARILGAAMLAGELSLHAALAEGSLVKAHSELGRKGK